MSICGVGHTRQISKRIDIPIAAKDYRPLRSPSASLLKQRRTAPRRRQRPTRAECEGSMILGFHYHQPAIGDTDGIRMSYFLGSFIDSIAANFREVRLFLHTPNAEEAEEIGYRLKNKNVTLVSLGPHWRVYVRLACIPYYRWLFRRHSQDVDAMLFRASTPLLPFVAPFFKRNFLYFVSDGSKGMEVNPNQPVHRMKLIQWWIRYYCYREEQVARNATCLSNSLELQSNWQRQLGSTIKFIPSTTLREADIRPLPARPLRDPIRLLTVGRLSFNKGLLNVLEAARLLRAGGRSVTVDVVGDFGHEDRYKSEVLSFVEKHEMTKTVRFHGFVQGGDQLWEIYRQADVFVVASDGEGFPRVIWEALASAVPVVATRVGSIPHLVEGAVTLVAPKSPSSLAEGIARTVDDDAYREDLIKAGFERVGSNTLERRGRELSDFIEGALS